MSDRYVVTHGDGDAAVVNAARSTRPARVVLVVVGLMWVWVGLMGLLRPKTVADLVELGMSTPMAKLEIRTFYGALSLAIGWLHLRSAWGPRWWPAGLYGSAFLMGALAAGRLFSMALDGDVGLAAWVYFAMEAACSVAAAATLVWTRRGSADPSL